MAALEPTARSNELRACAWGSSSLLTGLDGSELGPDAIAAVLEGAERLPSEARVRSLSVVDGTELRRDQSHSGKLLVELDSPTGSHELLLYLKKVVPALLPPKELQDLRRDLLSNLNEARFYQEFAPVLIQRGVPLLRPLLVDERLAVGESAAELEPAHGDDAAAERALRRGGLLLLMDSVEGYFQYSPLVAPHAQDALTALARFHAAMWQDEALLSRVAARMHSSGGYWTLEKRPQDLELVESHWTSFLGQFTMSAPELLERPEIVALASRLQKLAREVSARVAAKPAERFATVIHGDYKAMNVFLRDTTLATAATREVAPAVLIDFQWTGLGHGAGDVAMLLCHSVAVELLAEGEEAERGLLEHYRAALLEALARRAVSVELYTQEVAWHHYCLGIVDYSRTLLGTFLKGASPEAFARRSKEMNVGLAYRNIEASLLWVRRLDRSLRYLQTHGLDL